MSSYPEDQKAYEESMAKTQADLAKAAAGGQEYVRGVLTDSSKSVSELAGIARQAAELSAKHATLAGTEEAQKQASQAQTMADVAAGKAAKEAGIHVVATGAKGTLIIGTEPSTNQLIVKDIDTGKISHISAGGAEGMKQANIQLQDLQALQTTNPVLYRTLSTQGIKAYTKLAIEQIENIQKQIAAQETVTWEEFNKWIENEAPAELRERYNAAGGRERGYAAIKKDLDKMNAEYSEYLKARTELLGSANKVINYIDKGIQPTGSGMSAGLGLTGAEQNALGRALDSLGIKPVDGSYLKAWKQLDDDTKIEVALAFDADYTKDNAFSSVAKDIENISSKGLGYELLFAPIKPITSPIGKQLVLEEAKAQLTKDYANELQLLRNYIKADGSVDIGRLDKDFNNKPNFADSILAATRYKTTDDLVANMEYYNYASRVTPKEWAVAGLVATLDVLLMGGGNALANLGTAGGQVIRPSLNASGKIVGHVLSEGVPVALGSIQAPEVVKLVTSPKATTGEKALAITFESLLFIPAIGAATRGVQFAYLSSKGDYVPLRSMSMEAATRRIEFTTNELTAMKKAGVTEADIIAEGTRINQVLASGAKYVDAKFGPVTRRIMNVPYEADVSLSLFHGTNDITAYDRGGSIPVAKELYTETKVALEPIERTYLTGQRATKPGIVEIRISDPELISKVAPQRKLIYDGKVLEPEAPIPSLDELMGMGYRLEPIPGKAGKGVTFDATLGKIEIRRFTLSKVVDNPSGLVQIKTGQTGNGGVVAISDLHGTSNYKAVYEDINVGFSEPVIKGDPNNPATWEWSASANKGRTVVILGDSIDRGASYELWRDTFNRLHDQANKAGDRLERVIGNHELAYLSDDAIKGITYTDKTRAIIKQALIEDIQSGKVKAAISADGKLFTHAGVSKGVFGEYAGKSPDYVAKDLNRIVLRAVGKNDYSGKIFAKGRVEKGNSLSKNERNQGGIFWLRPQEATEAQLDFGFPQVVGHNPGWAVRKIWGDNFIEIDVRRGSGGTGSYINTPYIKTISARILTESLGGKAPELTAKVMTGLKLKAMRDTVADLFLGWDGRIYAIERLKASEQAVRELARVLDKQIAERRAAGDSIGVKFLMRQKSELTSATGKDYLYGGVAFWRDLVMGRQNSVKTLGDIANAPKPTLIAAVATIDTVRNQITQMSDKDLNNLFGHDRKYIYDSLKTSTINRNDLASFRASVESISDRLIDIIDEGLERSIVAYLDSEAIAQRYANRLQYEMSLTYGGRTPYVAEYKQFAYSNYAPYSKPYPEPYKPTTKGIYTPNITPSKITTPTKTVPGRVPTPTPIPTPMPGLLRRQTRVQLNQEVGETQQKKYEGAVAWQQGGLLRHGKLVPVWKVWSRPYRQSDLETMFEDQLPVGVKTVDGIKSAYSTVQQFRGEVAPRETQAADIGAFIATVHQPTEKPGGAGEISFTRDSSSKIRGKNPESWRKLSLHTTIEQLIEVAFRSSNSEVAGLSNVKLEALEMESVKKEKPSAKVKFAKNKLAEKLSEIKPAEIVSVIKKAGLTSSERKELLMMLPDRERKQVEFILSEPEELYAPTRGTPKASYTTSKLRRKKITTKKTSEPALAAVRA